MMPVLNYFPQKKRINIQCSIYLFLIICLFVECMTPVYASEDTNKNIQNVNADKGWGSDCGSMSEEMEDLEFEEEFESVEKEKNSPETSIKQYDQIKVTQSFERNGVMLNKDDILTVHIMGKSLIEVKPETGFMETVWIKHEDLANTTFINHHGVENFDSDTCMDIEKIETDKDFEVIIWSGSESICVLAKPNVESRTHKELDFGTKIHVRRTAHDDYFMCTMGYIFRHQVKQMTNGINLEINPRYAMMMNPTITYTSNYLTERESKKKLFFILFKKFVESGLPKHIIRMISLFYPVRMPRLCIGSEEPKDSVDMVILLSQIFPKHIIFYFLIPYLYSIYE